MNETDRIRLEEFRQFKKEIRGSAEYLIVGMDVAKDKHHAFFGMATGLSKTYLRQVSASLLIYLKLAIRCLFQKQKNPSL